MFSRMSFRFGAIALQLLMSVFVLLIGCTAEGTVRSLQERFPQHSRDLNEVKDLLFEVAVSTKDFSLQSSQVTAGKGDLIDFFEKDGKPMTMSDALGTVFKNSENKLLRIKAIVTNLGADYVSVNTKDGLVWIIMRGGGALNPDQGYVFIRSKEVHPQRLKYSLAIPDQPGWYAYIN